MNAPALPSPALAIYLALSMLGLVLILCEQLLLGLRDAGPLLLVVGLATLVARFYWLPYAYLATVAFYQMRMEPFRGTAFLQPTDLLLSTGGLLYLVATLRVHALTRYLGPYDARLKISAALNPHALPPNPRSPQGASAVEFAWLIVMIPVAILFAQVLGQYLDSFGENEPLAIIWILVGGTLLVYSLFDFWHRTQMDEETSKLYLIESLWQESRSDQDKLSATLARRRWFTWRSAVRLVWTAIKIIVTLTVLQQLRELRR